MKCDELTPIDLECNMGKDSVTGLVNREPWKAYDIDEVDAAIAELKAKLKESEEARYEAGADAADYYQENRRLKRALYKACANWSHLSVAFFSSYAIKEQWRKMENKCLAKAEEYK